MKDPKQFRRLTLWIVLVFGVLVPLGSFGSCLALGGNSFQTQNGNQTVTDIASLIFLLSLVFAASELTAWVIAEIVYAIFYRRNH